MKSSNRQNNNIVGFNWLWRYFPLPRSIKEDIKWVLFTLFPFLFNKWVTYQNWKNARVYRNNKLNVFKRVFWRRKCQRSYPISIPNLSMKNSTSAKHKGGLAVVVHVFYPEIFKEIIDLLRLHQNVDFSLYLTGTGHVLSEIKPLINSKDYSSVYTLETANHGRDILPFLKVLPKVFEDGHNIVLKLHTKGSNHLNRKDHWRKQLFSKLIGKGSIENAMKIFQCNPNIGRGGPSGKILVKREDGVAKGKRVQELSDKMGLKKEQLQDLNFVAGSMFYARREVLKPILNLNLTENYFEVEAGQTDGTLAHAIERGFAAGLIVAGLQLADTKYSLENPVLTVYKKNKHII